MDKSIAKEKLTLLIRGVNVISVANQSPNGLSQTVSV